MMNSAGELLEKQVKEMKWHENVWKKQGEASARSRKPKPTSTTEISGIIGTAAERR